MNRAPVQARSYPLDWPSWKARTPSNEREKSQFGGAHTHWNNALKDLQTEVDRLGGIALVLSTNQPTRLDGNPQGSEFNAAEPGAAVYFMLAGEQVVLACDKWATLPENIRAITLTLKAMRGQDRWGAITKRETFAGVSTSALSVRKEEDWRIILGLPRNTKLSRRDITEAFHEQAKYAHPDKGGNEIAWNRLNDARDRALREIMA